MFFKRGVIDAVQFVIGCGWVYLFGGFLVLIEYFLGRIVINPKSFCTWFASHFFYIIFWCWIAVTFCTILYSFQESIYIAFSIFTYKMEALVWIACEISFLSGWNGLNGSHIIWQGILFLWTVRPSIGVAEVNDCLKRLYSNSFTNLFCFHWYLNGK